MESRETGIITINANTSVFVLYVLMKPVVNRTYIGE